MPARHQGEGRGQVEWPRSGLVSLEHKLLARKHWSLLCPAHMRLLGLKQSSADLGSSAGSMVRILAWLSCCDRVQSTHLVALLYTDCSWHSQADWRQQSSSRWQAWAQFPKGWGLGPAPCVSWGKLDRDAREQRGRDSLWLTHYPFQPPKVQVRMGYMCSTRLFFSWV